MTRQTAEQIALLRDALTMKPDVRKIILFGSRAHGKVDAESDIDLCVIADLQNKRKIEFMREIRRALIDLISKPLDILVYSEDEFMERAKLRNTLEHKIMSDGIRVYG